MFFKKLDNKCEIIKNDSEFEKQIKALEKLKAEYPDNEKIKNELRNCEKGLWGEKQLLFHLKNSNLGMAVLHDVNMQFEDLKAQVDFIVFTKGYTYFIECKNFYGDVKVNERGEFIKTYTYDNFTRSSGMESPITQAQRHIEVFKKIWNVQNKNLRKLLYDTKSLDVWNRPLVVMSNSQNILDTRNAPQDIQDKIMKVDVVVDKIKKDIEGVDKDLYSSRKERNNNAKKILQFYNRTINKDYYKIYKEKFVDNTTLDREKRESEDNRLREALKDFRIQKAKSRGIPYTFVFNDEELEKIVKLKPCNLKELKDANILTDVKLKLHGQDIVVVVESMKGV